MDRRTTGTDETSSLKRNSDGLVEMLWEMLIALLVTAAISTSVISLSSHVSEASRVRAADAAVPQAISQTGALSRSVAASGKSLQFN